MSLLYAPLTRPPAQPLQAAPQIPPMRTGRRSGANCSSPARGCRHTPVGGAKGGVMRRPLRLLLLVPLVGACDNNRVPSGTNVGVARRSTSAAPASRTGPTVYGGKTADQWAKALRGGDREEIGEAC